ncbi:hypothetical protein GCM10008915_71440 [Bifidobacterium pullorum subsp. gallinarum]
MDTIYLIVTMHSNDFIEFEYDDFRMPAGKLNGYFGNLIIDL